MVALSHSPSFSFASLQVSELQKEQSLMKLKIEDTERSLNVEKALSSKLYDDVRFHCIAKSQLLV